MMHRQGFLLALGCNIQPQENMANMVCALLSEFEQLTISRVLKIPPVGMNSFREFLNAIVFVETELSLTELKAFCNQVEIKLGRDRGDPLSKLKDRPADIDILCSLNLPADADRAVSQITDEFFLYPIMRELLAYLSDSNEVSPPEGVLITLSDLHFGQTATTINWNRRSRYERVL